MVSCALILALWAPVQALAWGSTGHREINLVAMQTLRGDEPAFLRTPATIEAVELLGPEMDNLKGSGASWDADNNPGHYLDLGDDGTIAGVVPLSALSKDMPAYAKALASANTDPYRIGYLPYTIADGFEQLRTDFGLWRVFNYLATHAASAADRAAFARRTTLREMLTIRDLGVWGHFVGDGSQPLHVSVHYNGWGDYPNPHGYSTAHDVHARFEGEFVRDHVTATAVAKMVASTEPAAPAGELSQTEILSIVGRYLGATGATVPTLYEIEKSGGFATASPQAVTFATARVAAGAQELRDLVDLAWSNSLTIKVGYPEIAVSAILSGSAQPTLASFGGD
jgi:hypothetical protein